jgi:hypothetical protein
MKTVNKMAERTYTAKNCTQEEMEESGGGVRGTGVACVGGACLLRLYKTTVVVKQNACLLVCGVRCSSLS